MLGERPLLLGELPEKPLEGVVAIHRNERFLFRHLTLLEEVLHEADEPRVVLRDSRLRRELDHVVVPRVNDRAEASLEVQEGVEAQDEDEMGEVWSAPAVPARELPEGRVGG